jgi:dihydroneopterin aldolase
MRLHAYHGVLEQERRVGNDYVMNVRVRYPLDRACESDDVSDTLSYAELANIVRQEMAVSSKLLENVAQRICNAVIREYPETESVSIDIKKIAPPMSADCDGAGVRITIYN